MTHEEIEACRKRLQEILRQKKANGEYEPSVRNDLEALATEVGASTSFYLPEMRREFTSGNPPSILAHNIQQALQTASMIDACRTAAENVKVAERAQRDANRAQQVAFWSMIAAWGAVVVNIVMTYIMAAPK